MAEVLGTTQPEPDGDVPKGRLADAHMGNTGAAGGAIVGIHPYPADVEVSLVICK